MAFSTKRGGFFKYIVNLSYKYKYNKSLRIIVIMLTFFENTPIFR